MKDQIQKSPPVPHQERREGELSERATYKHKRNHPPRQVSMIGSTKLVCGDDSLDQPTRALHSLAKRLSPVAVPAAGGGPQVSPQKHEGVVSRGGVAPAFFSARRPREPSKYLSDGRRTDGQREGRKGTGAHTFSISVCLECSSATTPQVPGLQMYSQQLRFYVRHARLQHIDPEHAGMEYLAGGTENKNIKASPPTRSNT